MKKTMWFITILMLVASYVGGASAQDIDGVKWSPGHYLKYKMSDSIVSARPVLQAEPRWGGIEIGIEWRDIESSEGVYDWSRVDEWVSLVEESGDKLLAIFSDRDWGGTCSSEPVVPDYMIPWGQFPLLRDETGCIAVLHESAVMDREIAAITAFINRYDSNPSVLGISVSETAVANLKNHPTYTSAGFVASLIRLNSEVGVVSDHTVFGQSMNFIAGGADTFNAMADVIEATGNGAIGTGDVFLDPEDWTEAYPVFIDRKEELSILIGGATGNIFPGDTADVIDLVVDSWGANYKTWKCWNRNIADYCNAEVIPALNAVNWKISEACPTSYTACSDGSVVVNNPPVLNPVGDRSVEEGSSIGIAVSATDPDADAIVLAAAPLPVGSSFTDAGDGTGSFSWPTASGDAGVYSVTFTATDDGSPVLSDSETIDITVTAVEPPREILYSLSSDRSIPMTLCCAVVSGDIYVFVEDTGDITRVRFYLDGVLVQTENRSPYDYEGTATGGLANPFDTTAMEDGAYTISADVDVGGVIESISAAFEIDNVPDGAIPDVPGGLSLSKNVDGSYAFTWDPVVADPTVSAYNVDMSATVRACNSLGCSEWAPAVGYTE